MVINALKRTYSRVVLPDLLFVILDSFILLLSVFLSFWLRLAGPFRPDFVYSLFWMSISSILVGLPLFTLTGLYAILTRYVGSAALYRISARNCLLVLLMAAVGVMFRLPMPPRSSWILLWVILTTIISFSRFIFRDFLLNRIYPSDKALTRVAIYGSGAAAAQLAASLRISGSHKILTFLDDNPSKWNRSINGIKIQSPLVLDKISRNLDQVLLAIPSLSNSDRRRIVSNLQRYNLPFLQVPSSDALTSGRATIDSLRPIAIEDLLGRDVVFHDKYLSNHIINDSTVCVTGAGGSIGSELCLQILHLKPKLIILLEQSEPSLYIIDQNLRNLCPNANIVSILGSTTNKKLVRHIFSNYDIDLVFHSAAYKHVPLVELNPLVGLYNNVISTRTICEAAFATGVRQVVLISSDKAVRPTNVMGASKRLSELVVQAYAHLDSSTLFSMVRFGNVLDSSGSVVPLFRRQIADGGPITLTHPDIIRYFMTIPEAAQLVLQATEMAIGGDVFLLDMGEPIRIKDLAEQMVILSGLTIRDSLHPQGEIEIKCTGLRPGEKLFEELLIDADSLETKHPRIFRACEQSIVPDQLFPSIDILESYLSEHDLFNSLSLLSDLVPEWQPRVLLTPTNA